jgi:2-C-methyl-D-erythritol 4-phosphate cytidylyltransferase
MTVALIVAAGSGERLGAAVPKAFVELGGKTLLEHSIEAIGAATGIERIIVALPPGLHVFGLPAGVEGVEGGTARSDSVRLALAAAGEGDDLILVHDAARPLLRPELAERVIAALRDDPAADAAIAAAPVTDTIKRAGADGTVLETLRRNELWSIQTPQVFRREALARALAVDTAELAEATDDASLIERAGGTVIVVPADPGNLKVTTPVDLRLAELLLGERRAQAG